MVQETYTRRVQRVLSELVKDNKGSIELETLVEQVRAQPSPCGVRFRRHIDGALRREVQGKRIIVLSNPSPSISVTDAGRKFYAAWGSVLLYPSDHRRVTRMTIAQIVQYTQLMKGVLLEVQGIIRELRPYSQALLDDENIPIVVQELFGTVADLETANIELQQEFAYETARRREVRSIFRK
ncbi:hypothetical protein OH76DRAFT_1481325 [Lentinus brumalis]|uniref:Uncharacterized protein n=1 Tax=Lentinus brumalis TaxID=2498619 RepID=A0A371DH13_9APHY|nr:hypothetical protein OH76DRAFT_1481325 [Polyporus brumalis]